MFPLNEKKSSDMKKVYVVFYKSYEDVEHVHVSSSLENAISFVHEKAQLHHKNVTLYDVDEEIRKWGSYQCFYVYPKIIDEE